MHLHRHLGPLILDFARQFDSIIEKFMDSYFDLHIHPDLPLDLGAIPSTLPSLTVAHMAQLAKFQLRGLSVDGYLDFMSMSEVANAAFYALIFVIFVGLSLREFLVHFCVLPHILI